MAIRAAFISYFINKFDREIETVGLQEALRNTIRFSSSDVSMSHIDKKLADILQNKPVIVIANHPYFFEWISLTALLPRRRDIYLIFGMFKDISPNFDKHIIPVYIRHNITRRSINWLLNFIDIFMTLPNYSKEEEIEKNKASIITAAKKIDKGAAVLIFPNPATIRREKKWFTGIGKLVSSLHNRNNVYIVKAYVEGTSWLDVFRYFPGFGKILPKIRMRLSESKKVSESVSSNNPRVITAQLEKEYNGWSAKLSGITST